MTMKWEKKGLIYTPEGNGFFKSHAARPVPFRVSEKVLRLYYSSRDDDDRMLPTHIDVELENPSNILYVHEQPLLNLGRIGTFDDSGVTFGSIVDLDGETRAYYTGWKRRRIYVTFELSIGYCSKYDPDSEFKRDFEGPILAQDRNHPFLAAGPFVFFDGGIFKMWYCSGTGWVITDGNPEPLYRIHYAESKDGISWDPLKEPVVDYKFDGEVISAPWVIKSSTGYHMWYSTRGSGSKDEKKYSIGFAQSPDGKKWTRMDDQAGIGTSETGWDSQMICYPALYPYKDRIYMFYSGNNVGKGGMGYAVGENIFI